MRVGAAWVVVGSNKEGPWFIMPPQRSLDPHLNPSARRFADPLAPTSRAWTSRPRLRKETNETHQGRTPKHRHCVPKSHRRKKNARDTGTRMQKELKAAAAEEKGIGRVCACPCPAHTHTSGRRGTKSHRLQSKQDRDERIPLLSFSFFSFDPNTCYTYC